MKNLYQEIIEWNITALPENTLEMQWKKVEEELSEFSETASDGDLGRFLEEEADVFIAIVGLMRFDINLGLQKLESFLENIKDSVFEYFFLLDCVQRKFKELKKRKYKIVDGVYRHEEE